MLGGGQYPPGGPNQADKMAVKFLKNLANRL